MLINGPKKLLCPLYFLCALIVGLYQFKNREFPKKNCISQARNVELIARKTRREAT